MSLIDQHTSIIKRLCEQHSVRRLYAFGSVLIDQFKQGSDVDFIVDFKPLDLRQYSDNYFNFKYALEDAFQRPVDLLEEKAISNPYFLQSIEHKRQLIYGN